MICVKTDVHREDPLDRFNKGLMINLGLAHLRNRGWLLHLDADIVLPDRLRFILNKSRLDEDCLYGADRVNVVGRRDWEAIKQSAGYAAAISSPLPGESGRRPPARRAAGSQRVRLLPHRLLPVVALPASRPPLSLRARFGGAFRRALRACSGRPQRRILLPGLFVYHLESEPARIGTNWHGRVTRPFTS